ncbi:unnamed protein product [Musa acuminata subsp. malaccensis]|uniref:(wild Malaysian banana) hypothetical protein n=1 Tax=Musa acuminata subsp. malaccensis TaxID=214687 RepID=A0A804JWD3_MUSAM|nr:unnamed protein product [Musa acuminata subsp. malaccensis]
MFILDGGMTAQLICHSAGNHRIGASDEQSHGSLDDLSAKGCNQ